MQLVLINNRIVAHGENFLAMGGVVINTETGARYDNATVAECSGCPSDIDEVGYEYHAGVFVPCAPFFKRDGNVAGWCDDCKAPIDTGFPSQFLGKVFHTTYTGTGTIVAGVTCGFKPKYAIVSCQYYVTLGTNRLLQSYTAVMSEAGGIKIGTDVNISLDVSIAEDGLSFNYMNESGVEYSVIVFG